MASKHIQLIVLIAIARLPLSSPVSFECTTNDIGQTATGATCCRTSKDFGLYSCGSGSEPRKMLFAFDIPKISTPITALNNVIEKVSIEGRYGVLEGDKSQVNQALQHALILGAVISYIVYYTILTTKSSRLIRRITALALVATTAAFPCYYFCLLRIQNTVVRLPFMLSLFVYILRVIEAYFGFTPKGARQQSWIYCIYFILPAEIIYDEKTGRPTKATRIDALHCLWVIMHTFVFNTVLFSILCHCDYLPFGPTKAGRYDESAALLDYFNLHHLGNCYLLGLWWQQMLMWETSLVQFAIQTLTGWRCIPLIDSPLYATTKPSEFWSKRWDTVVHALLKRGIYKPARQYYSVITSSIIVFVASGLIHEWLVYLGFKYYRNDIEGAYYNPSNIVIGTNFLFFLYGFVPVTAEKFLGSFDVVKRIGNALPRPIKTFLVLMTSLPFAFWFIDPYLHGRLFLDYESVGYTIFKR